MRQDGFRAVQPPKFIPRATDGRHRKRVPPNLLLDQPKPAKLNSVWVSDITYKPLKGGKWVYLCVWIERADAPAILASGS